MTIVNLPPVFENKSWQGDNDTNWLISLAPILANYSATLDYDEAGNANVTITRNSDGKVILDMSLDNGEVNEINL